MRLASDANMRTGPSRRSAAHARSVAVEEENARLRVIKEELSHRTKNRDANIQSGEIGKIGMSSDDGSWIESVPAPNARRATLASMPQRLRASRANRQPAQMLAGLAKLTDIWERTLSRSQTSPPRPRVRGLAGQMHDRQKSRCPRGQCARLASTPR